MPNSANLNIYGQKVSSVGWHSGDETLIGSRSDSKFNVSVSFGATSTLNWKAKSCSDSALNSCWVHHGDLLIVHGHVQDEWQTCETRRWDLTTHLV